MCVVRAAILATALAALPHAVRAQDFVPAPPIAPGDMINYCVYGGLIYSVGSQICVMKGSPPLYCDQPAAATRAADPKARAGWTTSQPPATINCANDPVGFGPTRPQR